MAGRPTLFTDELANEICDRVSNGESIGDICKESYMPERPVVWRWRYENKTFSDMYDIAMKNKADFKCDQTDEYIKKLESGLIEPAAANVIINTLKWQAAKFYPRFYSDKQIVESKNETVNYNVDLPLTDADQAILTSLGFKADE